MPHQCYHKSPEAEAKVIDKAAVNFDSPGTLNEANSMQESTSPYWWVSSGGLLIIEKGIGRTNSKTAPLSNRWFLAYQLNNSLDTDNGRYPQNLFRLVSKDLVGDSDISMSFRISKVNLTDTPNRDAWSGIFILSRYEDSDNLYYAGARQDGHVVIKKKINGQYYTLGEVPYYKSYLPYQKDTNPNFIPGATWQKMRLVTKTEGDDIKLTLYLTKDANEKIGGDCEMERSDGGNHFLLLRTRAA